jgi:hypothetical protein
MRHQVIETVTGRGARQPRRRASKLQDRAPGAQHHRLQLEDGLRAAGGLRAANRAARRISDERGHRWFQRAGVARMVGSYTRRRLAPRAGASRVNAS